MGNLFFHKQQTFLNYICELETTTPHSPSRSLSSWSFECFNYSIILHHIGVLHCNTKRWRLSCIGLGRDFEKPLCRDGLNDAWIRNLYIFALLSYFFCTRYFSVAIIYVKLIQECMNLANVLDEMKMMEDKVHDEHAVFI